MSRNLIYLLLAIVAVGGVIVVYVVTRQPDPVVEAPKNPKFDHDKFYDTTKEERSNYQQ